MKIRLIIALLILMLLTGCGDVNKPLVDEGKVSVEKDVIVNNITEDIHKYVFSKQINDYNVIRYKITEINFVNSRNKSMVCYYYDDYRSGGLSCMEI